MKRHILFALVLMVISTACVCFGRPSAAAGDYAVKDVIVPMQHSVVFHQPDKFAAWPANNGVWMWDGKEILVGFSYGTYKVKESHDITGKTFNVLGRSLDGGLTWTVEDPENFVGDDTEVKELPGSIFFENPNLAIRVRNDTFFASFDRGKTWKGPYKIEGFDLPTNELTEVTNRTDYIVNGPDDCFIFASARKPDEFGSDRTFCLQTTDGARSFKFVSWVAGPDDPVRAVMPSTVRLSKTKLISAIRRRAYPEERAWIDVFATEDNGKSWEFLAKVGETGNWNGNPPAMTKLEDGRLICVYGNRTDRKMYASISNDQGNTWPERIIVRDDFRKGTEQDLGYPRVVQRSDGKVVAMYYWATDKLPQQHIEATIISVDEMVVPVKNAKHVIVDGGPEIFCAWPANNGLWTWGNELVVGYSKRQFEEKKGHNYANKLGGGRLARSLDGGETWKSEDPDNFVGDEQETTPSPGGINFAHPDFAMRIKKEPEQFWYSYDRGHTWKGPHLMGDLMSDPKLSGKEFTARTDYIVNNINDCLVFVSATRGESGSDFTFTARTTDGGKTFKWVSWIVPPTNPHRGVMPTTVQCSDKKLVTAIRRRWGKGKPCWIDTYVSNDKGNSWSFLSKVGDTGLWNGNPPALARLNDGRLCCVYGNRSRNQMIARFSSDEGVSWGPEIILRNDFQEDKFGDNDFGYPRLVQRPDGKMVAIYYWATKKHPQHHIAATIWQP